MAQAKLPLDVILLIVDQLTPPPAIIALPPNHTITQTLCSLSLTSHGIRPTALRLLLAHCCYISPPRLVPLLQLLDDHPNFRSCIHSLYLEPFPDWDIHCRPLCVQISRLLMHVAPTLKRLIADIPLRSLYPDDDTQGVRPILQQAFESLVNLEVACSTRDEFYLSSSAQHERFESFDDESWPAWTKLRVLALYNPDVSEEAIWRALAKLEYLETVIFTMSDGHDDADMKVLWRRFAVRGRPLRILMISDEDGHVRRRARQDEEGWKDDEVVVRMVNVPTSYYGDEDVIELCQEFTKKKLLRGVSLDKWD